MKTAAILLLPLALTAVTACEVDESFQTEDAGEEPEFRCQVFPPNNSCVPQYALFVRDEAGEPDNQFSVGSKIRLNIQTKLCLNACPAINNLQVLVVRNGIKVADLGVQKWDSPIWDWDESVWNPDTQQFETTPSGLLWTIPSNMYNAKFPEFGSPTEGYSYGFVLIEAGTPIGQTTSSASFEVAGSGLGVKDWLQHPVGGNSIPLWVWKQSDVGLPVKWNPSLGARNVRVRICNNYTCPLSKDLVGLSEWEFPPESMLKLKPGQYWVEVLSKDNAALWDKSGVFKLY